MPAIAAELTRGTESTTTSATFVDGGCTSSALANATDYLVIGLANARVDEADEDFVEMEARLGTTRLAVSRWAHLYDGFNTGDSATGLHFGFAAVVTGNGSDTLNMRFRAENAGYPQVRIGSQAWLAISLAELTENTDYWVADSASGDTAENTITDDDVFTVRCVMIAGGTTVLAPGEPQTITPVSDGTAEASGPTFMCIDVRALTASTEYTFQWEFDDNGAWEEGDAAGQLTFTPTETGDYLIVASCEAIDNGTTISYRRTRVFVLRLAAVAESAFITNAGNINVSGSSGTPVEGSNALTQSFTGDVVTLGFASFTFDTNWADGFLRRQGSPDVDTPAEGYMWNVEQATDYPCIALLDLAEGLSGSTSWNLVARSDSGGNARMGRNAANSAESRAVLVSFLLDTGSDDVILTPTGGSLRFASQAPTLSMATTLTPSAGSARFASQAPTVAPGAVTTTPGTGSARFAGQAPTVVPGAVTVADTTGSLRLTSQAPTLSAAILLAAGAGSLRFASVSPTLGVGGVILLPAAGRLRFRGNAAIIPGTVVAIVDTELVARIDSYEARVRVDAYEVRVRHDL